MNKLRTYAITAFLILVPLCYWPTYTRESQENFFKAACIILFSTFIGNIWLGAFLTLNILLFLYNGAAVGWSQVSNILLGSILFTFSRYFFSKNDFKMVYKPVMIVVCVSLVFMLLQLLHLDPMFTPITNGGQEISGPLNDPIGFFGIKEANGTFLTIALPMAVALNPVAGFLLLIPIKMSQSSGVYLAALIVILFYSWHRYRRFFKFICVLIPIAGFLIIKDLHTDPKTFTSRFPVWHSALSYSLKNPLGYGPDSYRNYNSHKNFKFVGDNFYNHAILTQEGKEARFTYYSPTKDVAKMQELMHNIDKTKISIGQMDEWDNPHNMYVNLLFQYGILGVILLWGLMGEMYFRFKSAIKDEELIVITSCLLVYFITGLTNFPLELARTAYLFPLLLGAFYNKTDEVIT